MIIPKLLIVLAIFLSIDMVWLLVVAKKFYASKIGFIMAKKPDLIAAFVFYIIFCIGLFYFCINPALEDDSVSTALLNGSLFGLVCYSTFDLTNQSVLKNWPKIVTVIDLIWGTFISLTVSVLSYYVIGAIW